MRYTLGIDVGTSYTAAAIWRADAPRPNKAEVVPLGNRTSSIASVLFLGGDGSLVVGEAAQRRALTDPDRVVREFKRRIGDDTPLFVGGEPHAAHDLAATLVRWVVDRVAEREGGPADQIAITHPATWGPYKKDLLRTALGALGLGDLTFLPEPEAAAISYASLERVEAGSTIAVYDLGGGTFDAAVVRKSGDGSFALLSSSDGLEQVGGADFDEAVFAHVQAALGAQFDALDVEDPNVLTASARLRRECTEAKEALSSDTEVSVPVLLPGVNTHVRLVRGELEEMIRPALQETVDSLSRALRSANVTSQDLGAVLLVGGSSRVPLVSQLVSAQLRCPVVVDADPKTTIALGAALSPGAHTEPVSLALPTTEPVGTAPMAPAPMAPAPGPAQPLPDTDRQAPQRPPMLPAEPEFIPGGRRTEAAPSRRRLVVLLALILTASGLLTGLFLSSSAAALLRNGEAGDGPGQTSTAGSPGDANAVVNPGDLAKISTVGSPNSPRGRANPAEGQTSAAVPGAPPTQVTDAAPGGRSIAPAPEPGPPAQPPSSIPQNNPPPTDPVSAGPPTTEPVPTGPPTTEPVPVGPPTTEPVPTGPPTTEPVPVDPPTAEPPSTGPGT